MDRLEVPMRSNLAYVAHPLGPDGPERVRNLKNASEWCAFLARRYALAPIAPWIVLARVWSESLDNRALGLEIDLDVVRAIGCVVVCGGRISAGMQLEIREARIVVELATFGYEVPLDGYADDLKRMDRLLLGAGFPRR